MANPDPRNPFAALSNPSSTSNPGFTSPIPSTVGGFNVRTLMDPNMMTPQSSVGQFSAGYGPAMRMAALDPNHPFYSPKEVIGHMIEQLNGSTVEVQAAMYSIIRGTGCSVGQLLEFLDIAEPFADQQVYMAERQLERMKHQQAAIKKAQHASQELGLLAKAEQVPFKDCTENVLKAKFTKINFLQDNYATIRMILKLESKEDLAALNKDDHDNLLWMVLKKLKDVGFFVHSGFEKHLQSLAAQHYIDGHRFPSRDILAGKRYSFAMKQCLVAIYLQIPELTVEDLGGPGRFNHSVFKHPSELKNEQQQQQAGVQQQQGAPPASAGP
mmetsp:Transcript_12464/g.23288  ORF Transcript_12464/g.23288 Transcript_12464/m.23288 type:complete len:327 (+) Transcript_12464:422-1402(+)